MIFNIVLLVLFMGTAYPKREGASFVVIGDFANMFNISVP